MYIDPNKPVSSCAFVLLALIFSSRLSVLAVLLRMPGSTMDLALICLSCRRGLISNGGENLFKTVDGVSLHKPFFHGPDITGKLLVKM